METTANNYYCCDCIHYMLGVLDNPCRKDKPSVGYLRRGCELWENENGEKIPEQMKVCKDCGRELPITMFGKDKSSPDYHKDWCKECRPRSKAAIKERSIAHQARRKEIAERTAKVCKDCGQMFPLTEFYKNNSSGDGREAICKVCYKKRKMAMNTKLCKKCNRELPLEQFGRHPKSHDGLQSICRECRGKIMSDANLKMRGEKKKEEEPERIVVREVMTDEQMVATLRERGWEVTCRKTITMEL